MKKPAAKKRVIPNLLSTRSIQILIVICVLITTLNNFRFSELTHNRDNISASWEAVTKDKTLFANVRDRDVIFSTTFNDAYEINAANLYLSTGIRLTEMWYPPYLWPTYLQCKVISSCPLDGVRRRVLATLPNVARSTLSYPQTAPTTSRRNADLQDWPTTLLKPGALKNARFWYFNIFLITPDVAFAYIAPMTDSEVSTVVVTSKAILYEMRVGKAIEIHPGFSGICLEKSAPDETIHTSLGAVQLSKWRIGAKNRLDPGGNVIDQIRSLDPREVSTGVCP